MAGGRKQRSEKRFNVALAPVAGWIALCIFLWPSFTDTVAEITTEISFGGYEAEVETLSGEERRRILSEANQYNEGIAREQKTRAFSYRGADATDAAYEAALSFSDGAMVYLRIPAIALTIPVFHGTEESVLKYAAGHMYGTSLPSGGESSHAVVTGHTGLPGAKLFTDLTSLAEDDLFEIHIAGEIHTYKVVSIRVVLPEEESFYLQVEEGRDLITLYTCTPYGINDHRLLVTGARCRTTEEETENAGTMRTIRTASLDAWLRLTGLVLIVIAGAVYAVFRMRRR